VTHNAEVSTEFGFSISTTGVQEQQGSELQISVVLTCKKTYWQKNVNSCDNE
jgi:hypothetical protein